MLNSSAVNWNPHCERDSLATQHSSRNSQPMPTIDRPQFQLSTQFIKADIQREVQLACASDLANPGGRAALTAAGVNHGGANFLAALGLLCYTEFFGALAYNHRKKNADGSLKLYNGKEQAAAAANFNSFFDYMGASYESFRKTPHNVYGLFRCGMAHQFFVKAGASAISIGENPNGIGVDYDRVNNVYMFFVLTYFRDLMTAVDRAENAGLITFPKTLPDL